MLNLWIHARIKMRENLDKGSSANLCEFEHQDFVTTIRGQQLSNAKCISHHQDFKSLVDGKMENTCTVIFLSSGEYMTQNRTNKLAWEHRLDDLIPTSLHETCYEWFATPL